MAFYIRGDKNIMEYKEFMGIVEKKLDSMSDNERYQWIYEYARTLDKSQREDFIQSLEKPMETSVLFDYQEFLDFLCKIKTEELYLEMFVEDYFNEIYHDWESEIYYIDNYVTKKINEYIDKACQCIYTKEYQKSYDILNKILSIEILAVNEEWDDREYLTINDLLDKNIVHISRYDYYKHFIYSAIQCQKKCEEIYDIFQNYARENLFVTDLMSFGPEKLLNIDAFMEEWILFLMKTEGDYAAKLLIDACLYVGGIDKLLDVAQKTYLIHPLLCKEACQKLIEKGQYEKGLIVAREAIAHIPVCKTICSQIVDLMIPFCLDADDLKIVAFLSEPTAFHSFRLFQSSIRIDKVKQEFSKINYESKDYETQELKDTYRTKEDILFYEFILGDYEKIVKICMNDSSQLGWSYSLKGKIIPILMMLLKPDRKSYVADANVLKEIETKIGFKSLDNLQFEDYFYIWKEKYILPDEFKKIVLNWLKEEIDKRAESVVGGGYRKSYAKVANQIIVLAEILKSYGQIDDIDSYVEMYKQKYSKKRAFKSEIAERMRQYIPNSL